MQKYMRFTFILFSLLILTTSHPSSITFRMGNFNKELLSSISRDNIISFIKEYGLLTLCCFSVVGIGFYKWYHAQFTSHINTDSKLENNNTAIPALKKKQECLAVDNKTVWIDPIADLPVCSLQLVLRNYIKNESKTTDIFSIPLHIREIDLLIKATHLLKNGILLFSFTSEEINILKEIAKKLKIDILQRTICNMEFLQELELHDQTVDSVDNISKLIMPTLLAMPGHLPTSISKDILSIELQPQIFTKEEYQKIHAPNEKYSDKLKNKDRTYTHDQKYYIVCKYEEIGNNNYLHTISVHTSINNKLVKTLTKQCNHYEKPRITVFPHSNKFAYAWPHVGESFWYRYIYSIYDIGQDIIIDLPAELPRFTQIDISTDEQFIACAAINGTYIINIIDSKNVVYNYIRQPNVKYIAFSPNGLQLVAGSTAEEWTHNPNGGTLELCDIKEIDWTSKNPILSEQIAVSIECAGIRFEDEKIIIANHHVGRFQNRDTVIDISNDKPTIIELPIEGDNTHTNGEKLPIYDTYIAKDRQVKNFHSYFTPNKELVIFSSSYKKLLLQSLDSCSGLLISSNRKYWANINFNFLRSFENNIFIPIETKVKGECLQLNDDGSFCLKTNNALNFYNKNQECYLTLDCTSPSWFTAHIKNNNQIICYQSDVYDTGDVIGYRSKIIQEGRMFLWQLPLQDHIDTVTACINKFSPLQYIFVRDICSHYKKSQAEGKKTTVFSIKPKSLHEEIFKSFSKENQTLLKDALRLTLS